MRGPGSYGEARVLHVVRVGGFIAAERAQEGENVLADDRVHLGWGEMLEARPAQIFVRTAPVLPNAIAALRKDPARHRLPEPGRLVLLQRVQASSRRRKSR